MHWGKLLDLVRLSVSAFQIDSVVIESRVGWGGGGGGGFFFKKDPEKF